MRAFALVALLGALSGSALSAQGKYTVKVPGGLAFAEFRGYEGWHVISISQDGPWIAAILGNPVMIAAYKAGIPGNGKPFPDGSKIAKLQWSQKKSTQAPFVVDVPDAFKQAFLMERDSKRFAKSDGWGYAVFNYDAKADAFSADPTGVVDCGQSCHVKVKDKQDSIFHPYQMR